MGKIKGVKEVADKLRTKIYNKTNRRDQDAQNISAKTYNKETKEILEMKRELGKLIQD
tara:strand:+ start:350 stop:523 length:174 start_codon:yes stop_codon:yes gene_type:complete